MSSDQPAPRQFTFPEAEAEIDANHKAVLDCFHLWYQILTCLTVRPSLSINWLDMIERVRQARLTASATINAPWLASNADISLLKNHNRAVSRLGHLSGVLNEAEFPLRQKKRPDPTALAKAVLKTARAYKVKLPSNEEFEETLCSLVEERRKLMEQAKWIIANAKASPPKSDELRPPSTTAPQTKPIVAVSEEQQPAATVAQADGVGSPREKQVSARAIESLLGAESQMVLDVVKSADSADNKMRAICGIDRRFLAWNSVKWAELLGITDAAIRKTPFWQVDRQLAINADKELKDE
jgi:hypothetical protein